MAHQVVSSKSAKLVTAFVSGRFTSTSTTRSSSTNSFIISIFINYIFRYIFVIVGLLFNKILNNIINNLSPKSEDCCGGSGGGEPSNKPREKFTYLQYDTEDEDNDNDSIDDGNDYNENGNEDHDDNNQREGNHDDHGDRNQDDDDCSQEYVDKVDNFLNWMYEFNGLLENQSSQTRPRLPTPRQQRLIRRSIDREDHEKSPIRPKEYNLRFPRKAATQSIQKTKEIYRSYQRRRLCVEFSNLSLEAEDTETEELRSSGQYNFQTPRNSLLESPSNPREESLSPKSPEKSKYKTSESDPLFLDRESDDDDSVPLEYDDVEGTQLLDNSEWEDCFNDAQYPPPLELSKIERDSDGEEILNQVYRLEHILNECDQNENNSGTHPAKGKERSIKDKFLSNIKKPKLKACSGQTRNSKIKKLFKKTLGQLKPKAREDKDDEDSYEKD